MRWIKIHKVSNLILFLFGQNKRVNFRHLRLWQNNKRTVIKQENLQLSDVLLPSRLAFSCQVTVCPFVALSKAYMLKMCSRVLSKPPTKVHILTSCVFWFPFWTLLDSMRWFFHILKSNKVINLIMCSLSLEPGNFCLICPKTQLIFKFVI